MTKITIDLDGIKNLREHALRAGTLAGWAEIAVEYMEQMNTAWKELSAALRTIRDKGDEHPDHYVAGEWYADIARAALDKAGLT